MVICTLQSRIFAFCACTPHRTQYVHARRPAPTAAPAWPCHSLLFTARDTAGLNSKVFSESVLCLPSTPYTSVANNPFLLTSESVPVDPSPTAAPAQPSARVVYAAQRCLARIKLPGFSTCATPCLPYMTQCNGRHPLLHPSPTSRI